MQLDSKSVVSTICGPLPHVATVNPLCHDVDWLMLPRKVLNPNSPVRGRPSCAAAATVRLRYIPLRTPDVTESAFRCPANPVPHPDREARERFQGFQISLPRAT